jgi:phenylacetate-CoA ligase
MTSAHRTFELRSVLPGLEWPALPPPGAGGQLALLYQLDASQWWTPEALERAQLRQLRSLLAHAAATVPHYRQRLGNFDLAAPLTPQRWRELPFLTRRDIQDAGDDGLRSRRTPPEHGRIGASQTSGSTGQPVKTYGTSLTRLFWRALTVREHLWHERDFMAKFCSIRIAPKAQAPDGQSGVGWGPATDALVRTGPTALLSLKTDVGAQAQWLMREDPVYLLSYPTNLRALARHCLAHGLRPARLREVRTIGETVTPEVREAVTEAWGAKITDVYSSQEVGYIALECPSGSGLYHLQSESLLVEILDEAGAPCRPGEVGRVVASSLHNFAMPLVRYDMRDYAEAGPPCPCGRGLPTLARVLGRKRNMLVLPGGEKRWPLTGFMKYRDIAPIRQYQVVQKDLENIEARLVVDAALSRRQEEALAEVIRTFLGHPFRVSFTYLEAFPPHAGGKFEDFISLLDT